jgi:hypothetical protein
LSDVDPRLRDGLQKGLVVSLVVLGGLCIVVGVSVALGAAWLFYLLVQDPKSIALVAQVLGMGAREFRAFRGTFGGESFEIELGEPLFWLLALLVGAILLSVLVGIAKGLIAAGAELLRPVLAELRRTP